MHATDVSRPWKPDVSRMLASAGAALLVAAALFLALVVPTQAHSPSTYPFVPGDGSYAWLASNHKVVYGCDAQSDGHKAYLRLTRFDGTVLDPVYDPDGAGGWCAGAVVGFTIRSYNICVQSEGCGKPKYWYEF